MSVERNTKEENIGSQSGRVQNRRNQNIRLFLCLLLNAFFVITVVYSVLLMFFYSAQGNMSGWRTGIFVYFTVDSNIFCALTCLPMIWCCLVSLLKKDHALRLSPDMIRWKFAGTAAVTVTMMTVLLFLGPMYGYPSMFAGVNLYLHLLSPLAAFLSFTLLEKDYRLTGMETLLAVIPTLLYAIVYLRQVVLLGYENGGWQDFYGFNMGGRWYISVVAMLLASWLIGVALRAVHNMGPKGSAGQDH